MTLLCLMSVLFFFFFKQKTAYEMRISDWSSDVCSSDLHTRGFSQNGGRVKAVGRAWPSPRAGLLLRATLGAKADLLGQGAALLGVIGGDHRIVGIETPLLAIFVRGHIVMRHQVALQHLELFRSEEHTSEIQSLMRISYAAFCLKK